MERLKSSFLTAKKHLEVSDVVLIFSPGEKKTFARKICHTAGRNHLAGIVIKMSALGAEDPGFESHLRQDFSRSSHTSDLNIGTPVATLPGAWHYRVSAGTDRPGVSIL